MNTTAGLEAEDFDTLDNILDDLRERFEETPQWEFCEGFMAALVCCRRAIPDSEWLPMLLGVGLLFGQSYPLLLLIGFLAVVPICALLALCEILLVYGRDGADA